MKSPKTTVAGTAAIIMGVIGLINAFQTNGPGKDASVTTSVASILSGIGLFFAKDEPKPLK